MTVFERAVLINAPLQIVLATTMIWIGILIAFSMTSVDKGVTGYRLPGNVKPSHYRLDLITDLENFKFNGEVWIKVTCIKATSTVVLHSVGLTIGKNGVMVKEVGQDNAELNPLKVIEQTHVPNNDFYVLKLDKSLQGDHQYLIYLPFNGTLESSLSGYYRSSYVDRGANTTRWVAVTQFEPSDARRAFPCFDEPGMKANFSIRLAHKDNLSAVSNMPIQQTTPMANRKGWVWDEFQESVPMSTYLVAWMVSDFSQGEAPPRPNNVLFRIWARNEAIDQIGFAADVGPNVLEFFEKLFDVAYPLPKQDMAAIPDFSAGAMENWGFITYRETALLYDPKSPSIFNQQRVAYVVAHELAHQWFGNLVTMKWWTDLWLNEGFATYVGTLGVHNVMPNMNYLDEASIEYIVAVYELDSLKSSHPISVTVGPPSEVREIFDAISYKKGSSVIRMMHNFLGDSFPIGVSNYLKTYQYDNAEQDDLWAALTEQAHKDQVLDPELTVKQIMDSWTLQTGYPLLKVERDYKTGTVHVSQSRFLKIPSSSEKGNQSCWWFPLTYTTQSEANFKNTLPKQWLKCSNERVELTDLKVPDNEWVILNVELTAIARVMYDSKNWDLIIKTLKSDNFKIIGPLNRAGLLLDVFDFANRGDLSYETALQLSSYLGQETDYIPLARGFGSLSFLDLMLSRTSDYGIYRDYMKTILNPLYERYGKIAEVPESVEETKIHQLLNRQFCRFGIGDCSTQAKQLFELWRQADLDKSNPIPADLQSLVLCTAVKYGDESTWNAIWSRYLVSNLASEKSTLLKALSCTREIWLLNRYLDWSIDEKSAIRKQDSLTVFIYVAARDHGFPLAWSFFQRKIKDIYNYHAPRSEKVGRYILSLARQVMFQDELDSLNSLLDANKEYLEGAKLQVQQSLENAVANVKWHQKNYGKVVSLLVAS